MTITWLSVALAVIGYLVGVGSLMTDAGLDPDLVKRLIAIMSILGGIGNTILAVLTKPGLATRYYNMLTRRQQ